MPITKIKRQNIATNAITSEKIGQALYAEITSNSNSAISLLNTAATAVNAVPRINTISYTNSSYYVVDDTAANTGGGYIKITGENFVIGAQVIIDTTNATSVSYINATTLHVQVPAKSAATYTVYVVNTDGSTATKPLGITYSANPLWVTGSTLANVQANQAFTGSFSATGATSYAVASGSSLPTGMTLVTANGYYYGNISIGTQTTYNFDITAIDAENQDSERSFSITFNVDSLWIREISSASYDNYAAQLGVDSNNNVYVVADSRAVGSGAPSSNNTLITKYTNLGARQFTVYDNTNTPQEEEVTSQSIDIYDDVLYYGSTSAVDSGNNSQNRNHKLWAVHTGNAATFWSVSSSFYHPTYDFLDDEHCSVVVDQNYVTSFFGIDSRVLHGGYSNRPRTMMASRFHKANSSIVESYQYFYTNSYNNQSSGSNHQICFDTVTNRTDQTFICGEGSSSGSMRGFVTRITTSHAKDSNPAFYSASNWSFSHSVVRFRKLAMDSSYVYAIGNGASDAYCYVFKFNRSNGSIVWQKYLSIAGDTLRAGGICLDAEGLEDVYVQIHKSDFSKSYIVKLNSSADITWQRAVRQNSGSGVISKGLDNSNNNLFALYTINTSPKKVLLFKFLKDGTGTSTYGSYIFETTTDIGITNTSYSSEESVHTNFAPSGGSLHSPSGVLNSTTYRLNAAPFLTYTDITG